MARIKPLYAVEHEAQKGTGLDAPARATLRQQKSVPRLASLKDWLDQVATTALPKSPLGEAVTYSRNQWAALNVYGTDGDLAIGRVERWRGGLGQAHRLPALSSAGASLA